MSWKARWKPSDRAPRGGGFNRGGNLMLNAPLIDDRLAMRVVLTDKYTDGWINRIVENNFPPPTGPGPCGPGWPGCTRGDVTAVTPTEIVPRVNWERLQGGRVELLAQPTDALKINATALYQKITMGDYNEYDLPPGMPDAHFQPFNNYEPFYDEFRLYGLTVTYDLSFAQFTSATAYYSREESQTSDVSEALYSVVGLFGVSIAAVLPDSLQRNRFHAPIQRGDSPGLDRQGPASMDRGSVLQQLRIHLLRIQRLGAAGLHFGGRRRGESGRQSSIRRTIPIT